LYKNAHAPVLLTEITKNEKPWITEYFRQLLERRNVAFKAGTAVPYRKLRTRLIGYGKVENCILLK
jgi:hypothetical protein